MHGAVQRAEVEDGELMQVLEAVQRPRPPLLISRLSTVSSTEDDVDAGRTLPLWNR